MNILFLGYPDCKLIEYLRTKYKTISTQKKVDQIFCEKNNIDWIISYGYRHIIKKSLIEKYKNRIVNLHISYLPYNKGCFPNVWSIIDNTPTGITIHLIDEGIDTGHILVQKKVKIEDSETLESSYNRLNEAIQDLFIENWEKIYQNKILSKRQKECGSYHTLKTSLEFINQLEITWSMKVSDLKKKTDEQIINEIQNIRQKNNEHWMDVVKLAFKTSPKKARSIFKKIKYCDEKINFLLKELSDND